MNDWIRIARGPRSGHGVAEQSMPLPPPAPPADTLVPCPAHVPLLSPRMNRLARWSIMGRKDFNEALITVVKLSGVLQAFTGPARAPHVGGGVTS